MTVMALLKLSGKELEEWYKKSMDDLWKAEGKSREAMRFDPKEWRPIYLANEAQFKEAVDLKFKLEIIKFLENQNKRR